MANPFDQFDAAPAPANAFDQFDVPARPAIPNAPLGEPERSLTDYLGDAGTRVRQGLNNVVGGLVGAPVNIANIPGTLARPYIDLAQRAGADIPQAALDMVAPIQQPAAVQGIRESLALNNAELGADLSPTAQRQAQEFQQAEGFLPSVEYLLDNPSYAGTEFAAQIPQFLQIVPGSLPGTIAAQGVGAAAQNTQQAEDVLRADGLDEATIAERGADAFGPSLAINTALPYLIPGGASIERVLAGQAGKGIAREGAGRVGQLVASTLGETGTEAVQEGADQAIQNIATGRPVMEGVGQNAALGALIGGPGGLAAGTTEALAARAPAAAVRPAAEQAPSTAIDPAILAAGNAALGDVIPPQAAPVVQPATPEPTDDLDALLAANLPPEAVQQVQAALGSPDQQAAALATLGDLMGEPADPDAAFRRPDPAPAEATPAPPATEPRASLPAQDFVSELAARMRVSAQEQAARTAAPAAQSPAAPVGSRPAGGDFTETGNDRTQIRQESNPAPALDSAPAFKRQYRPTSRRDAKGRPIIEPVLNYQHDGLLQWLGANGGADFDNLKQQGGVDPASLRDAEVMRPFGRVGWPALRRQGGLTLDQLREKMQQDGWLPQDDPDAPATVGNNDALDLIMDAVNGQRVFHPVGGADARLSDQLDTMRGDEEARDGELAAALGFPDAAAMYDAIEASDARQEAAGFDQADYEEARSLSELAADSGLSEADVERIITQAGPEPAKQAAALWAALQENGNADRQAEGGRGARGGEAAVREPVEPLTLANPEPRAEAPREVAPSQGAGLFGAPTSRDFTDDAQRRKDAARDGKTGTGRTDMAAGDGELFAGRRPEQAEVPEALESADAQELTDADLTDDERAAFARQSVDRSALRARASQENGERDADANNLRDAVTKAVGGASVQVEYLRGMDGLPERTRRLLADRARARGTAQRTSGLYVPGKPPRVFLFTDVVTTPETAAFTAAHEIAGHHGLRALLGDGLNAALEIALQNPTVAAVADSMAKRRKSSDRLLMAEEALADLAAVARTGNYAEIEARHGVKVPLAMRSRLAAAIDNFIRRVKALFGKRGVTFTDADVRALLEYAWTAAKAEGGTIGGMAESTDNVPALQQQLAQVENDGFERLRKRGVRGGPEWDAVEKQAAAIRRQLFALTGDHYGRPKTKMVRPSSEELDAEYDSPSDVPQNVRQWVQKHSAIITSDATDAVRWGRIENTLRDERYPDGDLEIYRAVADGNEIRPGDWVTTEREYAEEHLRRYLGGRGSILTETVNGRDVLVSPTGNHEEAIYAPRSLSGPVKSTTDQTDTPANPSILESVEDAGASAEGRREEAVRPQTLAADDVRGADVDRGRKPGLLERQAQDVRDQVEALRNLLRGNVKNPQSVSRRLNDTRAAIFSSIMARARRLEARNPEAKSLRRLFNLVMAAPGDSRLVGETVNDAIHARAATFTNRVRNILSNNGLEAMTPIENAQLRAAMLGTESRVPANIGRTAAQLRKLMDVQREDMLDAGIDVGEVEDIGYLTRIYDEAKILDDEAGFQEAARKLFVEHEFPREVGASASDTFYGDGTLARFVGYARSAATTDATVAEALDALKAVARRYRTTSNTNDEAAEAIRIIRGIRQRVAASFGDMRASAWLHGIKTPDVSRFVNGVSPSGAPITKGRELSGAADTVMAPYMKTDMLDILDAYARTASRKIEHATRFGADGSKVQALIDAASREGVPPADLEQAVTLVDSVLGLNRKVPESHLKNAADFIHAWSYLALLGRATFSSLSESVTYALRTGNLVHTVAPLIQFQRAMTGSKKGKALNEMAQVIAVNGHKAVEDVLMNRLGGDYSMSPKWSRLMHRFFYATLLTPLTRAQRAYGVGAATGFLRHLSTNLRAGKDVVETRALLNEVGIADHEAFADWMLAQGTLPDARGMYDENGRPTPRGQDYMVAVRRIIDQSIQNPGAEHRPAWTNNPAGRLVTGIMSFSYASYENIIRREAAVMARQLKDQGRGRALKRSANALVAAAALVVAQTLTSTLRELLFNWDRFEDKDDDEIAEEMVALGLSRTFGLGSADPIIQAITGLKYRRTLSQTALGAGPGLLFQTLDAYGALMTDANSENTDTAENKAAKATYTAAITPAMNVILSRLPLIGGPAIMALSGANARNWFAEQFTTKPDAKTRLDDKYQAASKDLDAVLDTVNDRIAALPQEQWAQELETLKREYPSILAGVTLDVYADNASNRSKGRAGQPKTAGRDGKPGLKLEKSKKAGEGSVLGELEGYQHYDRYKKRFVSDEGIRDRIGDLNKAIKNLRTDHDVTIGDLMAFARKAPSVKPIMDEFWTADAQAQAKPAGTRLVNKVLDELMDLRRAEKRKALEVIEKGRRGEPIPRTE